jgi:hypothetical protein
MGQPGQTGLGQRALEPSADLETTLAAGIRVAIEMDSGGVIVEERPTSGPEGFGLGGGEIIISHRGLTLAIVHIVRTELTVDSAASRIVVDGNTC